MQGSDVRPRDRSGQWITIGFCVTLFALFASATITYKSGQELIHHGAWVAHSHEVIAELEAVERTVGEAESSQRGFVITGNPAYIERYDEYVRESQRHFERIQTLTADNATQQSRIPTFRQTLATKLHLMRQPLEARRRGAPEEAVAIIKTNRGKVAMDRLRERVDEMKATERSLLVTRITQTVRAQAAARASFFLGTAAGLLLLTGLFVLSLRFLRSRHLAQAAEEKHRNELEDRVRQRTADLKAANDNLEAFSYSVAHDLRGPLRAIGTQVHMLEEDLEDVPTEAKGRFANVHRHVRHMGRLMEDLLKLSHTTRGELHRTTVNLGDLACRILGEEASRNPRPDVSVEVQDGLVVDADPAMMDILLDNLLRNAWKYSGKTPDARIEFGREGNAYFVRDNGAGFDDRRFAEALEPFHRLHSDREFEGTGVGLAICNRIVERHGGRLWAKSQPGQGATIFFTLGE